MTIIYADLENHSLYADTKISFNDGRKPEAGHSKLRWFNGNVVALSGLVSLSAAIADVIAAHFGQSPISSANIKLEGYSPDETAEGFIMTPEAFWVVLFGHGVITIIPHGPGLSVTAGSGYQWFEAYRATGLQPIACFDTVCMKHNDCGYPVDQVVLIAETQADVRRLKLEAYQHTRLPMSDTVG